MPRYLCAGLLAILGLATFVFADTLTLKDGRVVRGTFLGGTARTIRMEVGDRIETFEVDQVTSLQFSSGSAEPAPRERPTILRPDVPERSYSRPAGVELPAGTPLVVRMIDSVDSERNRIGETFRASLDEPVLVNGETAIPRGADVTVKLVDDKQSGKLAGRTELTLDLISVVVHGRTVDVNTQAVTQASSGRGARTGKAVGGGAALGAIIGAIAGGGKGAAIGAGAGAGAGAAAEILTKGQRVRIPSETRLTFTLEYPIKI